MIVVGGVSHLYQGDLDIARHAVARLAALSHSADVAVEDFDYGAVAVVQRLEELRPRALVVLGAAGRGRPPGTVERRPVRNFSLPPGAARNAIADAITGHITVDLLLEVAHGLGALPPQTVTIEVEPAVTGPSVELSPQCEAALEELVELALDEVGALTAAA